MSNLEKLRSEIDEIDEKIISLLGQRMEIAKEVAFIKKEENIKVLNSNREKEILDNIQKKVKRNLGEYIKEIYISIMTQSKKYQESVIKNNE